MRLADSLRYIRSQTTGRLKLPQEKWSRFLLQLETQSVPPIAFSLYADAVFAIEAGDLDQAARLFEELLSLPRHPGKTVIAELGDPRHDATARRYARFLDEDPTMAFAISAPSLAAARNCRGQIQEAFALMEAGDPPLAAEIHALLREIILGAGSEDPNSPVFEGASSFLLWGAIIINANRLHDAVAMLETLAHESAHNLLFGISADEPLVENSPDELYPSPLRSDRRPMDGIYHATFVTARMHRAVARLMESQLLSGSARETAARKLEENAALFERGIETVEQYGRLTSLGREVMAGATDYMNKTAASKR
jgi:HEXXH motif-containing protein